MKADVALEALDRATGAILVLLIRDVNTPVA